MLTPRQRSFLRGLAGRQPAILQVGKAGITEPVLRQLDEALAARELVKVRLLRNAPLDPDAAAERLAAAVRADVVAVAGRVVTLYRRHPERPCIALPGGDGD